MKTLTQVMTAALGRLTTVMAPDRREWTEALLAEAAEIPAGWQRLSWLTGGMRLTIREAARARRPWYPAAFAAMAGALPGAPGPGRPATPPSRSTGQTCSPSW